MEECAVADTELVVLGRATLQTHGVPGLGDEMAPVPFNKIPD